MTRRHFLDWSRPLLPQAAALLVDHYGGDAPEGGEVRMDGAVVVLPGSRAGRRLKELLLAVAEERGLRLVPPRVVTQGTLPELLYDAEAPVASGTLRRLVWAEALRTTASNPSGRAELESVFAGLPGSSTWVPGPGGGGAASLTEWSPLAREMARLARTVGAGGHRFRDVARRCGSGMLHDDAPRWRILGRIQDRVEARLAELGFRDPDLSRVRALEDGGVRLPGDVWLVGMAEVPGVMRNMLDAAAGDGLHAVVHAPESDAAGFDGLGLLRTSDWTARTLAIPEDRIRMEDRPSHQAEAVARILAGLGGARSPEEIVLGVPSADVVPALEERLSGAGVPVREAAGLALSASGPFRLLAAASDFLLERRYESLASLVRHPDLLPALEADDGTDTLPAGWLGALDRWYERHIPAVIPEPLPASFGGDGGTVRSLVDRVDRLLAPLRGEAAPLGGWVEPVLRFLADVYRYHEPDPGQERDRLLLRALEEIRWCAESLARLPDSLDEPCGAPAAVRLLLEEASGIRIPAPAREDAVEMLGWLEIHLDDAPVTVLTGVNEGALPESVRGDPFLPDALRGLLGLEDNRQRYARDVYRMTAVLHSREELWVVSGRRTAAGDPLRPSRLIFAGDDATVVARVTRFYGGGDAGEGVGETVEPLPGGSVNSGFRLPPEPEIPLDSFPSTISVTDFRALISDPYEWALRKVRGLETLDDAAVEMDGAVFGTLAHDVLQAFGRREVERHREGTVETDPRKVQEELEELLAREVASRFGRGAGWARVAVRLQVEQLRSRLREFGAWHCRWVSRGWRVKAAEVGTPAEVGLPFPYGEGRPPVGLRARIDRVDHHPESGEWAVFDYKTSDPGDPPDKVHRTGRREEEKVWRDLQLPLYHWLVTRLPGPDGAPLVPPSQAGSVRVGYIVLPRELEAVGDLLADWSPEVLESGVERARELLRELAEGPVTFRRDVRPAYPDEQVEALLGRSVLVSEGSDDQEEGDA